MDAVEFTYWLDGFLHDRAELTTKDMGVVREKMQMAIMVEKAHTAQNMFMRIAVGETEQ